MFDFPRQIADLEAEIEALSAAAERCRKSVVLGRAAAAAGGLGLVALLLGALSSRPAALLLAVAALVGGLAFSGSSGSTLTQLRASLQEREARRRALIDALEPRTVEPA